MNIGTAVRRQREDLRLARSHRLRVWSWWASVTLIVASCISLQWEVSSRGQALRAAEKQLAECQVELKEAG